MKKVLLPAFMFVFVIFSLPLSLQAAPRNNDIRKGLNFTSQLGMLYGGGIQFVESGNYTMDMQDGISYLLNLRLGYRVAKNLSAHLLISGDASSMLTSQPEYDSPIDGKYSVTGALGWMAGLGATYYIPVVDVSVSATIGAGNLAFVTDSQFYMSETGLSTQAQLVKEFWQGGAHSWGIGVIYKNTDAKFTEKNKYLRASVNGEYMGLMLTYSFF